MKHHSLMWMPSSYENSLYQATPAYRPIQKPLPNLLHILTPIHLFLLLLLLYFILMILMNVNLIIGRLYVNYIFIRMLLLLYIWIMMSFFELIRKCSKWHEEEYHGLIGLFFWKKMFPLWRFYHFRSVRRQGSLRCSLKNICWRGCGHKSHILIAVGRFIIVLCRTWTVFHLLKLFMYLIRLGCMMCLHSQFIFKLRVLS